MQEINNARQEKRCPYCGSDDIELIPEVHESSFRMFSCNNCLKGFVTVDAECPYCRFRDVSLCYAGEGSFEVWACNKCKKGFTKGEPE